MRITLADERGKVRFALRALLQQQADMEVVGEAANAQELIALADSDCPDLLLIDCELPGRDLSDLVDTLRGICPNAKIIALSGRDDARQAAQKAGVDAFVSKGDPPERLLSAIQGCARGCCAPWAARAHNTFAEEQMELAWELRGYTLNVCVLRRREAPGKAVPGEEQIVEPGRTHHPSEKAHEDLLYTCGSRFVGPMRWPFPP